MVRLIDLTGTPIQIHLACAAGVGSGVCVEHDNRPVNLITLYRAPKAERRSGSVNKLLDSSREEITVGVQDQCQQADGLILVIDPTSTGEKLH